MVVAASKTGHLDSFRMFAVHLFSVLVSRDTLILWYPIWHSIVGTTVTVHYDFLYLGKYLEEPHNISALKRVFLKHGCPRRQQSPNMAKISKSYILTQPHPQGHVMSVKCEEPIDELTVQVSLPYHQAKKKLWVYCHPTDPNFLPRLWRFLLYFQKTNISNITFLHSNNVFNMYWLNIIFATSILKVLLKQYMSPTGSNKYLRGITPAKTDKLKLDLF